MLSDCKVIFRKGSRFLWLLSANENRIFIANNGLLYSEYKYTQGIKLPKKVVLCLEYLPDFTIKYNLSTADLNQYSFAPAGM